MSPLPAGIVASARRAPTGGPIVSDTFTRADGPLGNAETGQPWIETGGTTWAVASGKAYRTAAGFNDDGAYCPALVDTGVAAMKATVTPNDWLFSNLWLRASTSRTGYRIEWRNDNGRIYIGRIGVGYLATSGTGILSTAYPISVRVTDPDAATVRVEIIQNGVTIFSHDDTDAGRITTDTHAGFSAYATSIGYDDFTVEAA